MRQQHTLDLNGSVRYTEAHPGFWDQAKAPKGNMSTGRNVIALSAVAGGSLMPFQVDLPDTWTDSISFLQCKSSVHWGHYSAFPMPSLP